MVHCSRHMKTYSAQISSTINAPATVVWGVLTDPERIKRYMYDLDVHTDWQVGSPITWTGGQNGKTYEDKGIILACDPPRVLRMSRWSPLWGTEDIPENYQTIGYQLTEQNGQTVLTLAQSGNKTQEEVNSMTADGWRPILETLKWHAELIAKDSQRQRPQVS